MLTGNIVFSGERKIKDRKFVSDVGERR